MEALTIAILKTVATSCIKYYVTALLAGTQITYSKADLGYKVPQWYMNPGRAKDFYSYGTSVEGDEFQSLGHAGEQAVNQMVEFIRVSNMRIISENINYDASNLKQKRLVELFVRGDRLQDFIRMNAQPDRKQLVKVETPQEDMRAFVRLKLPAKIYNEFQTTELNELKRKLMRQKTEDILSEIDAEVKSMGDISDARPGSAGAAPRQTGDTGDVPGGSVSGIDSAFDELNRELNKQPGK